MTHLQALAMLLIGAMLGACGNKGDLFLVPSEATEADLENIDEVLDELEGRQDDRPSGSTPPDRSGSDTERSEIDDATGGEPRDVDDEDERPSDSMTDRVQGDEDDTDDETNERKKTDG